MVLESIVKVNKPRQQSSSSLYCLRGLTPAQECCLDSTEETVCVWRSWFDITPVPVWVEDFSALAARFQELRSSGVTDIEAWIRANPAAVKAMAQQVQVVDANAAAVHLLGASDKSQLLGNLSIGFDETSYDTFAEELVKIARGERRFSVDIAAHTMRGEHKLLRMQWSTGAGHEDDLSVVFLSALDIRDLVNTQADLKKALKAKDFFLREIEHRVRNTLTLIDSLLEMAAASSPDSKHLLYSIARRVDALAAVHDSLYQSEDPSLADLAECVGGSSRQAFHRCSEPGHVRLNLVLESASIPIEAAAPVALLTSELVAAFLAAFPQTAVLCVEAKKQADGSGYVAVATDAVLAPLDSPVPEGKLTDALVAQLHGSLVRQELDSGYKVSVTFPFFYPGR